MITRIIAIDPQPRDPREDVIVYQVPEHSRAYELLVQLIQEAGIEHIEINSVRKPKSECGQRAARTDETAQTT